MSRKTQQLNVLTNLSHPTNTHRDIYASDCAIAALATLLISTITIIYFPHNDMSLTYSYLPYPNNTNIPTLPHLPTITLWQSHEHFQLLLPFQLHLPCITQNLLPLPAIHEPFPIGSPITITPSTSYPIHSQCLFTATQNHFPISFCPHPCDPYCQHHYSAFRPTTIQRSPPKPHSSQIITLVSLSSNTPILDISGTINTTPNLYTTPITSLYHSDVLLSHPLLRMLFCHTNPNCHLSPLLIADPIPHLKFSSLLLPISPRKNPSSTRTSPYSPSPVLQPLSSSLVNYLQLPEDLSSFPAPTSISYRALSSNPTEHHRVWIKFADD